MTEDRFDELLREIREEPAPDSSPARERVWRRLAGTATAACGEFRQDFDAYRAGSLSESRRLLLDDHLARCPECRRVMAGEPERPRVTAMPATPAWKAAPRWTRWAIAAGVALGALCVGRDRIDSALAPSGPRATVVSVSGAAYKLPQSALRPGATLSENDVIRTAAGSRAVLQLADGSRVELNQRTELAVQAAWSGQTLRLDRGDVIVQAAKQRRGHLRVLTRDSVTSVKGTVFAVSCAGSGSLVTVIEGRVEVAQPGSTSVLTPGKQAATSASLDRIDVRQAIAWSSEAEKYYALLAQFIDIEKQLAASAPRGLRAEPRLLKYLLTGAKIYAAIPNLDGTIRDALRLIDQRAKESAALNEWWSSDKGQEMRRTLDRLQAVTPYLGEEVVFMVSYDGPALIAHIQPDRQEALREGLDRLAADSGHPIAYRIAQDLLLVSENATALAAVAPLLGGGAASPFASEIAARYQNGVTWLLGIDVAAIAPAPPEEGQIVGVPNMRYLFFEQRFANGSDTNEATLSFQGARTGVSSWLAAPGSSGSSEYVSSEAVFAMSGSTKNPQQALEEILSISPRLTEDLRRVETETGVNLSADVAASLGTDFTIAVERPSLPTPGWVAAFEVVRPAALDDAIRRFVQAHASSDAPVTFSQETANGRSWNLLSGSGLTLYWTYDRGYLIASTDRALAARAIQVREAGTSLVRSLNFQQRFPDTGSLHHSGFVWLNTNGVLADLAGLVQSPAVKTLLNSRDPLLVTVDGETERIRAASRNRLTSVLLDAMLIGGVHGNGPL